MCILAKHREQGKKLGDCYIKCIGNQQNEGEILGYKRKKWQDKINQK